MPNEEGTAADPSDVPGVDAADADANTNSCNQGVCSKNFRGCRWLSENGAAAMRLPSAACALQVSRQRCGMTSSTTRPFGEIAGVDVFRAIVILITQRGTDKAHGRLLHAQPHRSTKLQHILKSGPAMTGLCSTDSRLVYRVSAATPHCCPLLSRSLAAHGSSGLISSAVRPGRGDGWIPYNHEACRKRGFHPSCEPAAGS